MRFARFVAPLALVVTLAAFASQQGGDTIVLVVRHAEKSGASGDVPLSAEGEARARALLPIAREAGVSAVITTQFQRTRQTADPAVQALGIAPLVVSAGPTAEHAKAIADSIRSRYAGRSVLVVGHSNTVPAIVAALGGAARPDLCDDQYDALFTVVVPATGAARVVVSRYGAPSVLTEKCAGMMMK